MLDLFSAIAGNPEREALLDALVCNSESAAMKVLDGDTDHADLLEDTFFTPFLLEVVHQQSWRMLNAFRHYGYDASVLLKKSSDDTSTTTTLGTVIAMESPEVIVGFRESAFGSTWKPFSVGRKNSDAVFGIVMGSDATHDYWEKEFVKLYSEKEIPRRRDEILIALYAISQFDKDPSAQKIADKRWNAWLEKWVDLSGPDPFMSALEEFRSLAYAHAPKNHVAEKALIGLLQWVRTHSSTISSPSSVVSTLAENKHWYDMSLAICAGYPFDPKASIHALLSSPSSRHDRDWKACWNAWCKEVSSLPQPSSIYAQLPSLCKNSSGHPLTAREMDGAGTASVAEEKAWNRAMALELSLPSSPSQPRLRL